MQVWLHSFPRPGITANAARAAEDAGYDGLLVADSQNPTADIWVELALAAAATERLGIGPGVTNPRTRHPAVTASAAATPPRPAPPPSASSARSSPPSATPRRGGAPSRR